VTGLRDPDTESAVIQWLKAWMGEGWYVHAEGEQLTTRPVPAIAVARAGGTGYDVDSDDTIEVTVVERDRAALWPACAEVTAAMRAIVGRGVAMVDEVEVTGRFAIADPNPNPDTRRASALFRLTVRPQ